MIVAIGTAYWFLQMVHTQGEEKFPQFVQRFNDDYGAEFKKHYPEIEIEFIEVPHMGRESGNSEYQVFVKNHMIEQKADVIYMWSDPVFTYLLEENVLLPLDEYIRRNDFDLSALSKMTVDRLHREGSIYGLAQSFETFSLVYNRGLFRQFNVPYPTDNMSWEELLQLIKQFPSNTIRGFSTFNDDAFWFTQHLAHTNQLSSVNQDLTRTEVNTPQWEQLYAMALDGLQAGAIVSRYDYSFENGEVAITSMTYEDIVTDLVNRNTTIDWAVVTEPVHPSKRNEKPFFGISDIFAINRSSVRPELAWNFVQFMNSDYVLDKMHITHPSKLLTNTKYQTEDPDDRNLAAFYKLTDSKFRPNDLDLHPDRRNQLLEIFQKEIQDAQTGVISLQQALSNMESKGNTMLANP